MIAAAAATFASQAVAEPPVFSPDMVPEIALTAPPEFRKGGEGPGPAATPPATPPMLMGLIGVTGWRIEPGSALPQISDATPLAEGVEIAPSAIDEIMAHSPSDPLEAELRARFGMMDPDMEVITGIASGDAGRRIAALSRVVAGQSPVIASDEAYEFPDPPEAPAGPGASPLAPVASSGDPVLDFLRSPDARDLIAGLSPEQIAGMFAGASGYSVPAQGAPVLTSTGASAASEISGVPDLDLNMGGVEEINLSAVPEGSDPISGESPLDAVRAAPSGQIVIPAVNPGPPGMIGDGGNLLLRGWEVTRSAAGAPVLVLENRPESEVMISEGAVVGALGRIDSIIESDDGSLRVSFSSGEILESRPGA